MSTTARKRREKAAPAVEETEPMCVAFFFFLSCRFERLDARLTRFYARMVTNRDEWIRASRCVPFAFAFA